MADVLTLNRYCGIEVFRIDAATVRQIGERGALGLQFEVGTDSNPLQTLEDTEELFACPSIEVALRISEAQIRNPSGFVLKVPYPEYPSLLYYVEHDVLRSVEVSLIAVEPSRIRARITGRARDVCIYDGSVPDTQLVLEASFAKIGYWPDV